MQTITKTEAGLPGRLFYKILPSGLKCTIIQRNDCRAVRCLVAVGFGAADRALYRRGVRQELPAGTAHFLEHKMFEQAEGDCFAAFAADGAQANAFTDAEKTVYYVATETGWERQLGRLLHMVSHTGFSAASVARERDIIGREIDMYDDRGDWRAYFQMLQALYPGKPWAEPVAGSRESIAPITARHLQNAHAAYYRPENMALVCLGPAEPERVLALAATKLAYPGAGELWPCIRGESARPPRPSRAVVRHTLALAQPVFAWGISLPAAAGELAAQTRQTALLELLFGGGSDFFGRAYDRGLLDEPPELLGMRGRGYACAALTGTSPVPERVRDLAVQAVEKARRDGFSVGAFERVCRRLRGDFLRRAGNPEQALVEQAALSLENTDLTAVAQAWRAITLAEVEGQLAWLKPEQTVLSVVGPA